MPWMVSIWAGVRRMFLSGLKPPTYGVIVFFCIDLTLVEIQ